MKMKMKMPKMSYHIRKFFGRPSHLEDYNRSQTQRASGGRVFFSSLQNAFGLLHRNPHPETNQPNPTPDTRDVLDISREALEDLKAQEAQEALKAQEAQAKAGELANRNVSPISELPTELLNEIFPRLSLQDRVRLSLVSKKMRNVVKSPYDVQKHLENQLMNGNAEPFIAQQDHIELLKRMSPIKWLPKKPLSGEKPYSEQKNDLDDSIVAAIDNASKDAPTHTISVINNHIVRPKIITKLSTKVGNLNSKLTDRELALLMGLAGKLPEKKERAKKAITDVVNNSESSPKHLAMAVLGCTSIIGGTNFSTGVPDTEYCMGILEKITKHQNFPLGVVNVEYLAARAKLQNQARHQVINPNDLFAFVGKTLHWANQGIEDPQTKTYGLAAAALALQASAPRIQNAQIVPFCQSIKNIVNHPAKSSSARFLAALALSNLPEAFWQPNSPGRSPIIAACSDIVKHSRDAATLVAITTAVKDSPHGNNDVSQLLQEISNKSHTLDSSEHKAIVAFLRGSKKQIDVPSAMNQEVSLHLRPELQSLLSNEMSWFFNRVFEASLAKDGVYRINAPTYPLDVTTFLSTQAKKSQRTAVSRQQFQDRGPVESERIQESDHVVIPRTEPPPRAPRSTMGQGNTRNGR